MDKLKEIDINNLMVCQNDPYLHPFKGDLQLRFNKFMNKLQFLNETEGGIENFSRCYKNYGLHYDHDRIRFKEWLPGAKQIFLMGDFNNWNRSQYPMQKDQYGNFTLDILNNEDGTCKIPHNSKIKLHIEGYNGQWNDRIPAWIKYAVQDENTKVFDGVFWNPKKPYQMKNQKPSKPKTLKIYEMHVGMGGISPQVHSYQEAIHEILPRVVKLGYNCVQLMAIMEHAYYGSFGYHVTNFFAISSRFGNPDDLKQLIDEAHGMGLYVIMDLVHSHASSNVQDGLNMLDGTDHYLFHSGPKGKHELWDSILFNYELHETQRFLLSNIAYYMEEFGFDGFRFDGITSMLYVHHGLSVGFSGNYHEYFSEQTDIDAVVYLMLANYLIHQINPNAISIAEDVSGMPTLSSPILYGGVGFDYRLAMAIPDKWIKLLKDVADDHHWNMQDITHTLSNRRWEEKVIAYAESHDQALVGDKTLAMWLFDKEIYFNMSTFQDETLVVNRGMSLHKMIRLITCGLGGDAYLNFMGNEFGHPEWIDFPREGNNWSYQHCLRRWDLVDDNNLRYKYLNKFDEQMIQTENKFEWLQSKDEYITLHHEEDKIIAFERGCLLFIFNFHPTKSYTDYRIGTKWPQNHKTVLDTDSSYFGGLNRLTYGYENEYVSHHEPWQNRENYIQVYLPSRTAIVLKALN